MCVAHSGLLALPTVPSPRDIDSSRSRRTLRKVAAFSHKMWRAPARCFEASGALCVSARSLSQPSASEHDLIPVKLASDSFAKGDPEYQAPVPLERGISAALSFKDRQGCRESGSSALLPFKTQNRSATDARGSESGNVLRNSCIGETEGPNNAGVKLTVCGKCRLQGLSIMCLTDELNHVLGAHLITSLADGTSGS